MTSLAFLDTETTGLDPFHHEVWEVGVILRTEDGAETSRVWQLPVDLGKADPIALKIGRFRERRWDLPKLTSLREFAGDFARLTDGAHLVGAVVSFDEERLRRLLRRNGECPTWHYHLVDVEALAAGCLAGRTPCDPNAPTPQPPWNSNDLSLAVGVDPADYDRHTALGDAWWARAIYDAVIGGPR